MFIETIIGGTTKKASKNTWGKYNIKIRNFANMQLALMTSNKKETSFNIKVIGHNKENTASCEILNKNLVADAKTFLFDISPSAIANGDCYSYDIVISSDEEISFSVVAIYTIPRYSANESDVELDTHDTDMDEPEPEDSLEFCQFQDGTITSCNQQGGVIILPSSYSINDGKVCVGNDFVIDTIGDCILRNAKDYTEIIIPDSIINFQCYGLQIELDKACKKIVTGNGFGKGVLDTYPFGHTVYCESFEVGTGLTKIDGYLFGAFNTSTTTIKFASEQPPELTSSIWISILSNLQHILVPKNSVELWKTSRCWNELADLIEGY